VETLYKLPLSTGTIPLPMPSPPPHPHALSCRRPSIQNSHYAHCIPSSSTAALSYGRPGRFPKGEGVMLLGVEVNWKVLLAQRSLLCGCGGCGELKSCRPLFGHLPTQNLYKMWVHPTWVGDPHSTHF